MELSLNFLIQRFNIVFGDVFSVHLFSRYFHVYLVCQVLNVQRLFIQPKVFSSSTHECLLITNDFAVKCVDDRIGLFKKTVDSTDLLQILFPFAGMLDYNTKINIFVSGLDSSCNFLALIDKNNVRRQCRCYRLNQQ